MKTKAHKYTALLLLIVCFLAASPAMSAQKRGEKTFGVKTGYVSRNESALAGLTFGYTFSKHFRLAPEVGIIFRHENLDGLDISLNTHFPFAFANGKASVYPFTGFNFTSWGRHDKDINSPESDDVTTHVNSVGINFGTGLSYRCTQSLGLHIEARYTLMRHLPTAFVTAGISYIF